MSRETIIRSEAPPAIRLGRLGAGMCVLAISLFRTSGAYAAPPGRSASPDLQIPRRASDVVTSGDLGSSASVNRVTPVEAAHSDNEVRRCLSPAYVFGGIGPDCNENGVDDETDITTGTSEDCTDSGIPDECELVEILVGTNSGGVVGGAKVFRYSEGTNWVDFTSGGIGDASAVMDLEYYRGQLYAGVQTVPGLGGQWGDGEVWRYTPDGGWTRVGGLDNSVMVLETYAGRLYAATDAGELYSCTWCDGSDWEVVPGGGGSGFRSAMVSSICGEPELFLGELEYDIFWRYNLTDGLVFLDDNGGSCVWDFAEFEDGLFAGCFAGDGRIYRTEVELDCAEPNFVSIHETYEQNWAMAHFQGLLYVGSATLYPDVSGARLQTYDGETWALVEYWPTTNANEGVTALATLGDEYLYVGLGMSDGAYYTGDGVGEVWRYDGSSFMRLSDVDFFGGGVQCLLISSEALDCNLNRIPDACDLDDGGSLDCNSNGRPDECEPDCNGNEVADECDITSETSDDCNANGIPDECESDCNQNGVPDDCDVVEGTSPDCNQNLVPDECDIANGSSGDCNHNASPDECEPDCNGNAVPDECGACCRGSSCEYSLKEDCAGAEGIWAPWASCDEQSCIPGACCHADQCAIVVRIECDGVGGMFNPWVFQCDFPPPGICSSGACCFAEGLCNDTTLGSLGPCAYAGGQYIPSRTCNNYTCPFAWPPPCPDGAVEWVEPPDGIVDARQPHAMRDRTKLDGYHTFRVDVPLGAGLEAANGCWSLCETGDNGVPNAIQRVVINDQCMYTVILERPITAGALTTLKYTTDPPGSHTVEGAFFFLPGDVDGSHDVSAADIDRLIDCANGLACPEWQGDIDRSGAASARDILQLINLLNGAHDFDAWLGHTVPSACR